MRSEANKIHKLLLKALETVDDHGTTGPRLLDEALRLWNRTQKMLKLNLIDQSAAHLDALELACYALMLPLRQSKLNPAGKLGRTNIKDRAEAAAEMLIGILENHLDDQLLDTTARLLHELPQRSPVLDEAKLLADAINLDDFSVVGLLQTTSQLSLSGQGAKQVIEGLEKRHQYGYWEARLKDGFHFEPIRQLAKQRLSTLQSLAKMLADEAGEDQAL